MSRSKVVLVHDYLREYGGAEKVLESLNEIRHDAPIYTSTFEPEIMEKYRFKVPTGLIHTSFLQYFPFRYPLRKHYFFLYPLAFRSLKIDSDIILSSCSYASKFVRPREGGIHIAYIHSVPKFLWGYETETPSLEVLPFDKYLKSIYKNILPKIKRILRKMDFEAAQKINFIIANSKLTQDRIKKHYGRDSLVIYPPVDVKKFKGEVSDRKYYLVVSRLSSFKRVDVAIEAFNKLKKPLKIIGEGMDHGRLKSLSFSNIEFIGPVSDDKLSELMRGCTALIFPTSEDFGITPIEAMAAGKPVIAYRGGGALETVVEGKTGEFFDKQTADSLLEIVKKFNPKDYNKDECRSQASKFSKEEFKRKLKFFVEEAWINLKGS